MHVKDIMTSDPRVCSPNTNLGTAAALMLDGDCGILPVVADGRLVGVVTDRDLFIALATRNTRASDLTVGEVATAQVLSCRPDDDVYTVPATMKAHRIRRIPVEGFGGTVVGIVSMNDLVLAAGPRSRSKRGRCRHLSGNLCPPSSGATRHSSVSEGDSDDGQELLFGIV